MSYHAGSWGVALFGELDLATCSSLDALLHVVRADAQPLVLDLRGLGFIDSTGLHWLVRAVEAGERGGFPVTIVKGPAAVQRAMQISGLASALPLVDVRPATRDPGHAVIVTDISGLVTVWNAEAESMYGWSAEQAVGRPIIDLVVGPQDAAVAAEIMETVMSAGRWTGQFAVKRRDGIVVEANVTDHLVKDETGCSLGVVGISVPTRGRSAIAA